MRGLLLAALTLGTSTGASGPEGCRDQTPALRNMHWAPLQIAGRTVRARVADEEWERAAGMQRLCPAAVAAAPMLFLLPRPYRARFHMNNVFTPLDIAFLGADGRVLEIRRMEIGDELQARRPSSAALEAGAGQFVQWGLEVGDRIGWPAGLSGR